MKNKRFRKIVALILSVCILIPTTIMYISADIISDSSSIEVSGEKITLNLNFVKTYHYATGQTSEQHYANSNDVLGKSFALTNAAIADYNSINDTAFSIENITALKVSTADNAYLCGAFSTFIKQKLPQIEEIDMRDANVKTGYYSFSTDVEDGEIGENVYNALPKAFFGSTDDTVYLTNIKKIILPETLEKVRLQCFKGLSSLETIEFGSNFKSLGNSAFSNCSSLKELNLPDSLNEFTHDTAGYISGCSSLEKVSYHGDAEGVVDKTAFYTRLLTIVKANTVVKVDLSGSGIDSTMALEVANKAGLQSLDISNCANIEYTSEVGVSLYNKLISLKNSGIIVNMPVNPNVDYGEIEKSGEKITLNLNFVKTYHYATGQTSEQHYANSNDVLGKSFALTNAAIADYNSINDTAFSIENITALKVSTADNAYLCGAFSTFIKQKLPQIEEIDMRDANVKTGYYSFSTDVEDGEIGENVYNALPKAFFGSTDDTVYLTNIKKIILPETLEKVRLQCFQGLSSLETIEFGSNFKSLGNSAFRNCSSLKELNLPDSLNEFTHDTAGYISGCSSLEKVSYHGDAEGVVDKTAFYTRLLTIVKANTVVKVDLSGSGIDSTMALEIANKAGLQSLDISDCANIEWVSDTDKALYNKIESLISDGVTVKFTGSPKFGMMGDANNDGVVDIRDLVHIQSYIDGIIDEPLNDIVYIDLEGDGIGDNELIIMRRALLDIESHDEYYQRINAQ